MRTDYDVVFREEIMEIKLRKWIQRLRRKIVLIGKKYGVITRNTPTCGLFSFFIVYLGGINKCISEGLIPVIDMQTYRNMYLNEDQVGNVNAWEFYFCQPMNIGLEQINYKKSVIMDADCDILEENRPNINMWFLNDESRVDYWRQICHKYIRFKPDIQTYLDNQKEIVLDKLEGKKLGVLCRGTDYVSLKPKGHPIQPDTASVIEKARSVMEEKKCKYIFLATEDENILQQFHAAFTDHLIINQCKRYSNTGEQFLARIIQAEGDNQFQNGLEYLTTIYLLSRCNCFLSSRASGTLGALLMSDGFEWQYFWDCGVY